MSQTPKVIQLLADAVGAFIHSERLAASGSAILPGHLVEETGGEVQEHSTPGGDAQRLFALANLATGKSIDDAYAAAETVRYGAAHQGQEVYALVAAGATAIADGAPLQSAGDGTLENHAAPAQAVNEGGSGTYTVHQNSVVAYALGAVDNSGGGTAVRIRVRVA